MQLREILFTLITKPVSNNIVWRVYTANKIKLIKLYNTVTIYI